VQILTNICKQTKEHKKLRKLEREQAFLTRYYQTQDKDERKRLLRLMTSEDTTYTTEVAEWHDKKAMRNAQCFRKNEILYSLRCYFDMFFNFANRKGYW